jgi:hypothetical protein
MAKMQKKNLDTSPDEVRKFENGKIELANLGDVTIGPAVFGTRLELVEMRQTPNKNR